MTGGYAFGPRVGDYVITFRAPLAGGVMMTGAAAAALAIAWWNIMANYHHFAWMMYRPSAAGPPPLVAGSASVGRGLPAQCGGGGIVPQ